MLYRAVGVEGTPLLQTVCTYGSEDSTLKVKLRVEINSRMMERIKETIPSTKNTRMHESKAINLDADH